MVNVFCANPDDDDRVEQRRVPFSVESHFREYCCLPENGQLLFAPLADRIQIFKLRV